MLLNVIERGPEEIIPEQVGRPPIVLLHGLFGRARNLGFFQRRLARTRRTLAIDLRNHGDSPHGLMDYNVMAADLLETLAHHNALPATLVGHSMGGKVAMTLALSRPGMVHSLLVADIPPAHTGHGQFGLGEQMLRVSFPPFLNRAGADRLLQHYIANTDVRALMLQNIEVGENPHWTIGLREIVDSMPNVESWPYIPEGYTYPGPTLFLAGGNSPYIRREHYATMRRLFPCYRLELIEHAGHWLHVEHPQKFAELLENFTEST
ncbi:Abhydrolase domain-containing protein 11 [Gluconacetobacter sp. SXCC-1]|uniref:Alpha/beta fold hydrolase n=1 Tax=Komagataeibacter rhaeticus TaxID=215221 RepID=A0A181C731_9PROT|nr:alpha/beta fold hydrolase [Komagataeibacter rhaeticus]ATU73760.1 alpha/beta hydrolase [Komagataeibacter xylinus]EGG78307.1 Abhydrolase domain-containing protein 11 [Gluconacetobacter sp. SXCC-1]QIP34342.1 alpha/beta fold hydrolase [Komagataeibacter rhaeticus]QOC46853.1 alpha/beta fold hydrolase [Komagataeibacter rhaeticus]WPP20764.1 alpha/beta fold hydrolase [Komagataeibacter rhaeticus]